MANEAGYPQDVPEEIASLLRSVFTASGAVAFWEQSNQRLDGYSPRTIAADGGEREVIALLEALADGVMA